DDIFKAVKVRNCVSFESISYIKNVSITSNNYSFSKNTLNKFFCTHSVFNRLTRNWDITTVCFNFEVDFSNWLYTNFRVVLEFSDTSKCWSRITIKDWLRTCFSSNWFNCYIFIKRYYIISHIFNICTNVIRNYYSTRFSCKVSYLIIHNIVLEIRANFFFAIF